MLVDSCDIVFFGGVKMEKEMRVIFIDEAKNELNKLKNDVEQEIRNGKNGTFKQKLLKSIEITVQNLSFDHHHGFNIKKNIIPKYYIVKYEIKNLWKCNLFDFWRIIYTIRGEELYIVIDIIEFMDHRDYNKRFKYRS